LEEELGLKHVRYLRGYANVIQKAQLINEQQQQQQQGTMNAEVAIETSGHCAVKENGFLDDGTFTAVKVLGLLAQENRKRQNPSLLDLISSLKELEEVVEFRLPSTDGTLESMFGLFDFVALEIEALCEERDGWAVDRDNLEGIRVSTDSDGGYFLLRKSLHDPVMCLQVEAQSVGSAKSLIIDPLLNLFHSQPRISQTLDVSALQKYSSA
jgi:phosphomannomutase